MCGIAGIIHSDGRPVSKERLAAMSRALLHRGPDDEGFFLTESGAPSAGFAFRRLSIIDLSDGHQPMRHGRRVIVFNGEIYNFLELRRECEAQGSRFKTRSDTEVLLHLYDRLGEKMLEKLNGMFAFAIWDEEKRELFAARDRLGIKPFYYFYDGKTFAFASEIKALVRSGEVPLDFDRVGLMDFFAYRFVPAPHTVLKQVKKLRPGHFIRLSSSGQILESSYWTLREGPCPARSEAEAAEQLTALLEDSVRLQMISDVPLGAFLSGGVDSSLIAALMARRSPGKVQTFSIGFESGTGVDETEHARKVARHLGTEHHELVLTPKDLLHAERVFETMNEPVADPTVLPTAILSRFARERVKVALTGEGGDELFAGYNRYKAVLYAQWAGRFPGALRPMASAVLRRTGRGEAFRAIPDVGAHNWFLFNRDFSLGKLEPLFHLREANGSKWSSYLHPDDPSDIAAPHFSDPLNAVLDFERRTSLSDRLLMKVDMASMGCSLEARPPYLDHRMVEFAFSLPARYKIRNFKGKHVLRKAAERFLPSDICWRRKHGFIVPIARWINAGSRESLDALLDEKTLDSIGFFNGKAIQMEKEKIYNNQNMESIVLLWPAVVLSGWAKSLKNESPA
jgi:asparagine synthase (glutamine-hydrolysing)